MLALFKYGQLRQIHRSLSIHKTVKPKASDVLASYLRQTCHPHWTSYFVAYRDVQDDHYAQSHFNFSVGVDNYHILRTGCYPYIKYHATKRPVADLSLENNLFRLLKIANLCIPCLLYGLAAVLLIRHSEKVLTSTGASVTIYFLYPEDKSSRH